MVRGLDLGSGLGLGIE